MKDMQMSISYLAFQEVVGVRLYLRKKDWVCCLVRVWTDVCGSEDVSFVVVICIMAAINVSVTCLDVV